MNEGHKILWMSIVFALTLMLSKGQGRLLKWLETNHDLSLMPRVSTAVILVVRHAFLAFVLIFVGWAVYVFVSYWLMFG